jgi:hypothetical protein
LRASQRVAPLRDGRRGTVAFGHCSGVGLDLMTAVLAPDPGGWVLNAFKDGVSGGVMAASDLPAAVACCKGPLALTMDPARPKTAPASFSSSKSSRRPYPKGHTETGGGEARAPEGGTSPRCRLASSGGTSRRPGASCKR